jgi:RNA polymerase sigma-70 factor (ECF subfamily)
VGAGDEVAIDLALIDRVNARDAAAVAELYDRHARLLYGLALRIVGDRAGAEEVLHDVFVAAWTGTESYDPQHGPPVGWLVGMTRIRALARLRNTGAPLGGGDSPPSPPPVIERAETDAASVEERREIARALYALPTDERDFIEQAYYLGLTHSELAERHNLPVATIKTRIRSGMAALREQLALVYVQR